MVEVKWHRFFAVSFLLFALLLISASVYLHLQQKHRLGRLQHERAVTYQGVDAQVISATALPFFADQLQVNENAATPGYGFQHNPEETLHDSSHEWYRDNTAVAYKKTVETLDLSETETEIDTETEPEIETSTAATAKTTTTNTIEPTFTTKKTLSMHHIDEVCMQCLCDTTTECRSTTCSKGEICGFFRISRSYWLDAGKPLPQPASSSSTKSMNNNETSIPNDKAYSRCVNNMFCAARAVKEYMKKYARDCNQNGIIDCRDYISLHILGPNGCVQKELPTMFAKRMEKCLRSFDYETY